MRSRTLIVTLGFFMVSGFLVSSTALAERGHHGPPPLPEVIARHADEIGVTEAELDAIREIADGRKSELEALHDDVTEARMAVQEAMGDRGSKPAEVLALVDNVSAAEALLNRARAELALDVRAQLTEAQWQALAELREKRMDMREEARQERGGPGHKRGGGR